jgi:hypothetical protein
MTTGSGQEQPITRDVLLDARLATGPQIRSTDYWPTRSSDTPCALGSRDSGEMP